MRARSSLSDFPLDMSLVVGWVRCEDLWIFKVLLMEIELLLCLEFEVLRLIECGLVSSILFFLAH